MTARYKETLRGFPSPAWAYLPDSLALARDHAEHLKLWLRLARQPWRTLALVPGEEGMSTYEAARLLADIGARQGESIGIYDVRNVEVKGILDVIRVACRQMGEGDRIIFAARSIRENLATIPLARATDGVVLCAALGSTPIELCEETIDQVGKDHFFGSLLLRAPQSRGAAASHVPWYRLLEAR